MLRLLVPLIVFVAVVSGQDNTAELQGSPGWAAAEAEDLQLAATIDTSKPPKTCRPEIISKIDFGVATAAYQVSAGSQITFPARSTAGVQPTRSLLLSTQQHAA
jgi:hypothetical protein